MKRSSIMIITVLTLLVIGVGGYALFHKSNKTATSNQAASSKTSQAAAVSNAVLATKTNASLGQYLTELNGQALYTYGGDSSGVSNCTGSCLASWPAYQAKGSTAALPKGVGTIQRSDNGEVQYTYNGMPLYTFAGDSKGQVTGNGVANFRVAKPATATTTPATSPAPSYSPSSPY